MPRYEVQGTECFLEIGDNNEIREHASIHRSSGPSDRTVSQDVPRYTMVSGERAELRGLNLEGLRRSGFSLLEVKSLRAAYRKLFMPSDGLMRSFENRLTELEKDAELNQLSAVSYMIKSIQDSFGKERRGIANTGPGAYLDATYAVSLGALAQNNFSVPADSILL